MRYRFADCELDTEGALLHRAGYLLTLPRRVFAVLTYLLEHRGRVVSKDELAAEVWQATITDATIEGCIKKVRQAVGDSGRAQRVITTRFGYGYAFVAPVVVLSGDSRGHGASALSPGSQPCSRPEAAPPAASARRGHTGHTSPSSPRYPQERGRLLRSCVVGPYPPHGPGEAWTGCIARCASSTS